MKQLFRCAAAALIFVSSAVLAEETPASEGPATVVPVPETTTEGFGDWSKVCSTVGEETACEINQVVNHEAGRLFLTTIGYVADSEDPVLFMTAPLGMYLPRGITVRLTEDTLLQAVVQRCEQAGCIAVSKIEAGFLDAMKKMTEGQLIFGSTAERNVAVPLSLKGFAEAIEAIKPTAADS